jgi:hypothetical protein
MDNIGKLGMAGKLQSLISRAANPHSVKTILRLPGIGRVMFTRDPGNSNLFANQIFATRLMADHYDGDGRVVNQYDLGSGLVTNVGVLALTYDWNVAAPSGAPVNVFSLAEWHATGTGVTAAAATDIKLQTQSTNGGQTPVEGTTVAVSAANVQKFQTVATVAYTGTEAVTEWGLFLQSTLPSGALSVNTGTPFTAGTGTSGSVTGTPLTASSTTVQGQQNSIFEDTTAASWGYVISNSTSVITVPAWYKTADGTVGTTPSNADAYLIRPVMWDHKVFAAINVNNGDSIAFTYSLTINSGG